VFVAVSSVVQAVRQGSWTPVFSVSWLSAVVVAAWPGTYRRCPGRGVVLYSRASRCRLDCSVSSRRRMWTSSPLM
jgi:hypothetical protein